MPGRTVRRARIALSVAALTFSAGCYNAHGLHPNQLSELNGYQSTRGSREIRDGQGRDVRFDERSRLYLYRQNGERVGGRFDSIYVHDQYFAGKTADGQVLNLWLPEIQEVSVDAYSRGQTIAGIIIATAVVVGGIVLLATLNRDQNGWCGHPVCADPGSATAAPTPTRGLFTLPIGPR
jgi:hypothetical protein